MAKQSMMMTLPISSAQDELSIWEFVNQSDSDVDSDFEFQSFDLDDELLSSSSLSSSEAIDDVDGHDYDHGHGVDKQEVKSFDLDDDIRHPSSFTDDDDDDGHDDDDGDDNGVVAKDDDDVKCDDHDVGVDASVYDHDDGYGMGDEVGTHKRRKSLEMNVYIENLYDDDYDSHVHHDDDGEDDDDHVVDDDDGYGLDDELVPWDVKDVYERQRIRKSGKKSLTKFTKSKKPAVVFTRNGCVRGKYALGLNAR